MPLPDFYHCVGCELPRACATARSCSHLAAQRREQDDQMALTTTSAIWLRLLVEARNELEALTADDVRTRTRLKFESTTLPAMAERGQLVHVPASPNARYYVDDACTAPNKMTVAELATALAKRNERTTS